MFPLGPLLHNVAAMSGSAVSSPSGSLDTAWNSNYTYGGSGSALTATRLLAATGGQEFRALGTKTLPYTGQFAVTMPAGTFRVALGLQTPAATNNNVPGGSGADVGYLASGPLEANGSLVTTLAAYGAADVVICRIVGNLVGFKLNGSWLNSFDPVTGANGVDVSGFMSSVVAVVYDAWDSTTDSYTIDLTQWL